MSVLCRIGLHARIPLPSPGPFVEHRWGCRRCPATWTRFYFRADAIWQRMEDR